MTAAISLIGLNSAFAAPAEKFDLPAGSLCRGRRVGRAASDVNRRVFPPIGMDSALGSGMIAIG